MALSGVDQLPRRELRQSGGFSIRQLPLIKRFIYLAESLIN